MKRMLAALIFTVACDDASAPTAAGELWTPPDAESLWSQVVQCSGLARPAPGRVPTFYLSVGDFVEYVGEDGKVYSAFGLTRVHLNRIDIARAVVREGGWERTVRHEMLHELLFENPPHISSGHPTEFFNEKCGDIT